MVERTLTLVLEKITGLERLEQVLRKMEESVRVDFPLADKGKAKESDLLTNLGSTAVKGGISVPTPPSGSTAPFMGVESTEGGSSGGREGIWKGECPSHRLEMPVFDGVNPEGWVYRVEHYFTLNRLTEEEKLSAAAIALDQEALAWF
ncbi:hypothetical protein L484_004218 [Morus notabilis]|uniref:Uncharacterized protein n=1 Tax=Morus notabilis TaxID=981085 RepID=W9RUQ3_9ROSA|nr:hypothetical protein L484_004218 [Morus notabilis]